MSEAVSTDARTDGPSIPRPRTPRVIERTPPKTFTPSRNARRLRTVCDRCKAGVGRWCVQGRAGSKFGHVHPERGEDTPQ